MVALNQPDQQRKRLLLTEVDATEPSNSIKVSLHQKSNQTHAVKIAHAGWSIFGSTSSLDAVGVEPMKLWDKTAAMFILFFFIGAEWLSSEPTLGSVCISVVSPRWLPCQHVLTVDMLLITTQLSVAVRSVFCLKAELSRYNVCLSAAPDF